MSLIYLDNNATTRPDPRVIESMLPYLQENWGNPSSLHRFGADVRQAIDIARKNVAELIGAQRPTEIIFTSGGTESNHLAIRGLLASNPEKKHILTTQVEHPSVLELCKRLEKESYDVTYLPVNADGALDLNLLTKSIRNDTALASVMWANNETGVLFPIEKIAPIFAEKGIPLHVDATQVCGKLPIDVAPLPISALTIAAHKFHGPKGIGALYLRRGTSLRPQLLGGSQERSLRAGTENVAGIVGLGKTAELAKENIKKNCFKTAGLRDILESKILSNFSLAKRNGSPKNRLPNTASIRFEGLDGEAISLLLSEQNVAASTGSACSSGSLEPSHVLRAMGISPEKAKGTIRLSLSHETDQPEIDRFLEILREIIQRVAATFCHE